MCEGKPPYERVLLIPSGAGKVSELAPHLGMVVRIGVQERDQHAAEALHYGFALLGPLAALEAGDQGAEFFGEAEHYWSFSASTNASASSVR